MSEWMDSNEGELITIYLNEADHLELEVITEVGKNLSNLHNDNLRGILRRL